MLAIVGQHRVGRGHLHHDSQRPDLRRTVWLRIRRLPGLGAAATAATAMQLLAERRDEPHEDEPGTDPDDKPAEEVV
jgi:hypothetical protein